MAEWFQIKVDRLVKVNNNEEKKDILTEIKIKLGSCSHAEIEAIARSLDTGSLFLLFSSNDREVTEQICLIFKTLFEVLEPGEIYQKYPTRIYELISHSDVSVRSLILKELLSTASNQQTQLLLLTDVNLIVAVINRISDEDLTVATSAMCIIKEIGKDVNGLKILYHGEPLRTFAKLIVKNDNVSFRIYDVIINIAKNSKEALEATIQSGFLNSLINILQDVDILLQMNALETLTELALTEEGLNYLEQQNVLTELVQKIAQANENPLSSLLIPGLMKFFGNVARLWPNEIFSKYPIVVSSLFEVLDSENHIILGVALDTLGHVASSVEGKYALQALGDSMLYALKKIAEIIQRMPTELRISSMNNLTLILNVQSIEQDNRILSLTKSWFDALCDDPLGLIVGLSKQPFADIRSASLEVLAVVASQAWGQEYISTYPGLIEFLLDRNIETFKECKETKYKVVKCLSEAESYIFDANTMQKFKQFVNEGPFYVETNTEVAFESAT
ncbi:26S proteasome non-ATPase regulatory subunit 5 [Vespula pensylvanica]|nr:26S proteasome non-ATPase regulatory subunit 5 [Vespula pensylvanica]